MAILSFAQDDFLLNLEEEASDSLISLRYTDNQLALAQLFSDEIQDTLLLSRLKKGRVEEQRNHIRKAWSHYSLLMDSVVLCDHNQIQVQLLWGQFWALHQKYNRSKFYLEKAYQRAKDIENLKLQLEGVESLLFVYPKLNDFESAYLFSKRYLGVSDLIYTEEVKEKREQLNLKFETETKAKEIITLKNQKAEQELILASAKIKAKQWFLWGMSATLMLIIVATVFWIYFRNIQQVQRLAEQEAIFQKEQVVQTQEEHRNLALQAMLQGEALERSRVAKELHDGLGVLLSTLKLKLGSLDTNLPVEKGSLQLVDQASSEVRRIAHNMMPASLTKFGTLAAIEDLCDEFNYKGPLRITLQQFTFNQPIPHTVGIQVYRVLQEMLKLIESVTPVREVVVQLLQRDQRFILFVSFMGGKEQNVQIAKITETVIWQSVQNKVRYLGGDLTWESVNDEPDKTIIIDLPLDQVL